MNLVYDKYIEVSYALLEKQHEQEEFWLKTVIYLKNSTIERTFYEQSN
jgi:hypothetical protein